MSAAITTEGKPAVFIDLDGDGKREAVVGSSAVDNGMSLPDGTDDRHAYIYAIDAEGQLLWRTEMGDVMARAVPFALHMADGRTRLYAHVSCPLGFRQEFYNKPPLAYVAELDAQGRILRRYDEPSLVFSSFTTGDLDGDGSEEVLVADQSGYVHCLNADLQQVRKVPAMQSDGAPVDIQLVAVAHLLKSPRAQVVLLSSEIEKLFHPHTGDDDRVRIQELSRDYTLMVLDEKLRLLAQYPVAGKYAMRALRADCFDWDHDGRPEIVVRGDKVRVFKLTRRL